jgi:hypothetical protein
MNSSAAVTIAAIPLFMSAAPRPNSWPSRITGSNGSECQCSSGPAGTTSVWPAKQSTGPGPPSRRAQKLSTFPNRKRSTLNPSGSSRAIRSSWHPPSAGLTDGRETNCRARSRVDVIVRELLAAGRPGAALYTGASASQQASMCHNSVTKGA